MSSRTPPTTKPMSVGPKQYQAYRQLRLQKQMADEKLETAEINLEEQMAWDGWGGWGGWGPGWY